MDREDHTNLSLFVIAAWIAAIIFAIALCWSVSAGATEWRGNPLKSGKNAKYLWTEYVQSETGVTGWKFCSNFDQDVKEISGVSTVLILVDDQGASCDGCPEIKTVPSNITIWGMGGRLVGTTPYVIEGPVKGEPNQEIFGVDAGVSVSYPQPYWVGWWEGGVTAAPHSGASLMLVAPGTEIIDSGISLYTGQKLIGSGIDITTIEATSELAASGGTVMITNASTTSGNSGIVVANLTLQGNRNQVSGIEFRTETNDALIASGASNYDHRIEHVWIDGTGERGIFIRGGYNCRLTDVDVTRYGWIYTDGDENNPPARDGVRLNNGDKNYLTRVRVSNKDLITKQHTNNKTYGRHGIVLGEDTQGSTKLTDCVVDTTERMCLNVEGYADRTMISNFEGYNCGTHGIHGTADLFKLNNIHLENTGEIGIEFGGKGTTPLDGHVLASNIFILNPGSNPRGSHSANSDLSGLFVNKVGDHYSITNADVIGASAYGIYLNKGPGILSNSYAYGSQNDNIRIVNDEWTIIGSKALNSVAADGFSWGNIQGLTMIGNLAKNNVGEGFDVHTGSTGMMIANAGVSNVVNNYSGLVSASIQLLGNIESADDVSFSHAYSKMTTDEDVGYEVFKLDQRDENEAMFDLSGDTPIPVTSIFTGVTMTFLKAESGTSVLAKMQFQNEDAYYIIMWEKSDLPNFQMK